MVSLRNTAAVFVLAVCLRAAPEPPPFTLNDDVVPWRYSIELTVDPERDAFDGVARIEVDLRKRVTVIWLNATGLTISEASIELKGRTAAEKSRMLVPRITPVGADLLAVELDTPAQGHAVLTLQYQAQLASKAVIGPYRLQFEDHWYVFTTFTPAGARRAFPCFDQPRFKTSWELKIHVRRDLKAFANAKILHETDEPGGKKLIEFAPTEPLASEVVSFAVGPFDTLDAAQSGRKQIPIRVITPRGHAAEGDEAAIATPDILNRLEEYTGVPYPFDKLDQVAIPHLPFSAVENPGFITYRMQALLAPPGKATAAQTRLIRAIESHEMAHQWFGNLVTQMSWEDVWLSEGFATWLSAKIMDQDQPSARRHLSSIAARERIMTLDDSAKTRAVRLVMKDESMMKDVYSGFVYQKGAAVLAMLEGWLGENAFRAGLHAYLNGHRFGNATTADLAAALRLASQIDPAGVMYDFLDQSGIPVVRTEVHCEQGTPPRLIFEQVNTVSHWDVPVCWRTDTASSCIVVDTRRQAELPRGAPCPAWVYPNLNGSGYYRTLWTAEQLAHLDGGALAQLTGPERLTLVNDVAALRRLGKLDAAATDAVLKRLASDGEPEIAEAAAKALAPKK